MLAARKPRYPIPEAIPRPDFTGPYVIEDGYVSGVDLAKGKMVVSTGGPCSDCGQDHARASRIHEMGHTAFTPKDWQARVRRTKDKLPADLVNACEDARINARRQQAGLPTPPPLLCAEENEHYYIVRQAVRSGDLLGIARIVIASYRSGDAVPVSEAVAKVVGELAAKDDPIEQLKAHTVNRVRIEAESIASWYMWCRTAKFRHSLSMARDIIASVNGAGSALADAIEEQELAKQVKSTVYGHGKRPTQPANVHFGRLEIVRLPLPNRSKAGFERKWTARDEGPIPTRFDRWGIDKRIFRTKKRGKGAAVLIDASGSMNWTEEHLARVLDEVPAATIAIYSGSGSGGQLVVVAQNGRAASMRAAARYMNGGNVVDGPALDWLSEQPETVKLWMSDGGITGIGDGFAGEGGIAYCERAMRRGGIQQVRNAQGVMEVLTGKSPFTPSRKMIGRF